MADSTIQIAPARTEITEKQWTREEIELVKNTIAKGASDAQLALFLKVCATRGLDPFAKHIYYVASKGLVLTAIDGFRVIAERTGEYVPGKTRYEYDEKKALVAAYVSVMKFSHGQWFDVEESAFIEEYRQNSPIWKEKPRVMLAKCAEARALRRAFPLALSGLYAEEEINTNERTETPRQRDVTPPVAIDAPDIDVSAIVARIEAQPTLEKLSALAAEIKALQLSGEPRTLVLAAFRARKDDLSAARDEAIEASIKQESLND